MEEGDSRVSLKELQELQSRHEAFLRFLSGGRFIKSLEEGAERDYLSQSLKNILEGPALDISNKSKAGGGALRALDIPGVTEIYVPLNQDPSLAFAELVRVNEDRKKSLIKLLQGLPNNSMRLITIFDHSNGFIDAQAGPEIERILMPGGQRIITVRSELVIPTNDEPPPTFPNLYKDPLQRTLGSLAFPGSLPDLGDRWHEVGDAYTPNRFVNICTKPKGP